MGLRKTPLGGTEIFCDGCGEVILVGGPILVSMNVSAERAWQQPVEYEPSEAEREAGVRFFVRLRHGGGDRRWSKSCALKLPGDQREVSIREYPWLCDTDRDTDCGAKLRMPWERRDLSAWTQTGPGDPGEIPTNDAWKKACEARIGLSRQPLR